METEYRNISKFQKVRTGIMAGKTTIYGTDWCGFTTKQKQAFNKKGVKYDYIDCGKFPDRCKGISSYPVVEHNGSRWEGFKEIQ